MARKYGIKLTWNVVGAKSVDETDQHTRHQITEWLESLLLIGLIGGTERLGQCDVVEEECDIVLLLRTWLPPLSMEQNIVDIRIGVDPMPSPL